MIRNKCLLSIILALVCTTIYAQQDASTVRGRVVDADDSPVMYASVCLLAAGKVVAGVLTDTTGVFLIKGTFSGEYSVRLSSIGYEDVMKTIHIPMGQLTDVGRIVLTQKSTQLDGVVVSGRTAAKSITMEKTRINPAATMSAATGSVLDVPSRNNSKGRLSPKRKKRPKVPHQARSFGRHMTNSSGHVALPTNGLMPLTPVSVY